MKVQEEHSHFRISTDDGRHGVTVMKHNSLWDFAPIATINWSACGAVSVDFAREYVELLQEAIRIADDWNAKVIREEVANAQNPHFNGKD